MSHCIYKYQINGIKQATPIIIFINGARTIKLPSKKKIDAVNAIRTFMGEMPVDEEYNTGIRRQRSGNIKGSKPEEDITGTITPAIVNNILHETQRQLQDIKLIIMDSKKVGQEYDYIHFWPEVQEWGDNTLCFHIHYYQKQPLIELRFRYGYRELSDSGEIQRTFRDSLQNLQCMHGMKPSGRSGISFLLKKMIRVDTVNQLYKLAV